MDDLRNILLLTIDCMRSDCVDYSPLSAKVTPNLATLSKHCMNFSNAISNSSSTLPSFKSIFTSTHPLSYGGYGHITRRIKTLAEVLRGNGYRTSGFHSNPYFSLCPSYGRGFGLFKDLSMLEIHKPSSKASWRDRLGTVVESLPTRRSRNLGRLLLGFATERSSVDAVTITKEIIGELRKSKKEPFFIWAHYMDVHFPYLPRPRGNGNSPLGSISKLEAIRLNFKTFLNPSNFTPQEIQSILRLYRESMYYVDWHIGIVLDQLRKLDLMKNTLVLITSDHGEEFSEHGGFFHTSTLYDEVIRVPLLFYNPQLKEKNLLVDAQVDHLDIAPTVTDVLLEDGVDTFEGRSLSPVWKTGQISSKIVISEISKVNLPSIEGLGFSIDLDCRATSCRTRRWKYITDDERNTPELFNLLSDSKEKENLYPIRKKVGETFEEFLASHKLRQRTKQRLRTLSDSIPAEARDTYDGT